MKKLVTKVLRNSTFRIILWWMLSALTDVAVLIPVFRMLNIGSNENLKANIIILLVGVIIAAVYAAIIVIVKAWVDGTTIRRAIINCYRAD